MRMSYGQVTFLWLLALVCSVGATLMDHHMGYDDIQAYHYHPCTRPCTDDEPAKVCDYDFLVEHYHTLTKACYNCPMTQAECYRPHCVPADGASRGIMTVNRMMPGPAIHVCEGDTIRVRVHNKLEMSEGVTIHWHGVLQQGTPYMDGVGMVTQCSIPAHTSFTYTFKADTPGTHFWHAHSGLQRADGIFGHLVIRQPPKTEAHIGQYDLDMPAHAVLVNDWWGRSTAPSFAQHHNSDGTNKPTSMLINGKGMHHVFHDPSTGHNVTTPREVFTVSQGKRYRFRIVSNGILNCPIRISIDHHMITIIASDGSPVEPMEVESFSVFAGERYDFVLYANQTVSNYLLRARGQADCAERHNDAFQTAILRYEGAPEDMSLNTPFPELNGIELNPFNTKQTATKIQVSQLRSKIPDDPAVTRNPDKQVVVAMDFNKINNPRFHNEMFYSLQQVKTKNRRIYTPQMNHITMMLPPSPALSQFHDIPQDMFCNNASMSHKNCQEDFCECVHLEKANLGDVVEVILVDEGHPWDANHPTHLHGHGFRVVAMDKLGKSTYASEVQRMDAAGEITRNLDRPPKKDTVTVPDGGYVVLRFHANNPGVWFFHCHVEYHAEIGMGLLFQVGEPSQFPKLPRGFPQCGSWDGYGEEEEEGEGDGEEEEEEKDREMRDIEDRLERLEKKLEKVGDGEVKGDGEGHRMQAEVMVVGVISGLMCLVLGGRL